VSVVLRPLGIIVLPGVLQSGAATPAFLRLWAPRGSAKDVMGWEGEGISGFPSPTWAPSRRPRYSLKDLLDPEDRCPPAQVSKLSKT
jgi:hypothetical protein